MTLPASHPAPHLLGSEPDGLFGHVTRLARRLFDVPIALVSLADANRQWQPEASPGRRALVIPDAALDERFRDHPLVGGPPHVRFYAGQPLRVGRGSASGTLCLIDTRARDFSVDDAALLRDLAALAEQELSAARLGMTDELTLLSNQRGFETLAAHALGLCRRLHSPAALLLLDLDHFKSINDAYGQQEGERALKSFSELLTQAFRDSDVVGRLAGERFAVLLTNATGDTLLPVLNRLHRGVEQHNRDARRGYYLRFQAASALFDAERHQSVDDLLRDARPEPG